MNFGIVIGNVVKHAALMVITRKKAPWFFVKAARAHITKSAWATEALENTLSPRSVRGISSCNVVVAWVWLSTKMLAHLITDFALVVESLALPQELSDPA